MQVHTWNSADVSSAGPMWPGAPITLQHSLPPPTHVAPPPHSLSMHPSHMHPSHLHTLHMSHSIHAPASLSHHAPPPPSSAGTPATLLQSTQPNPAMHSAPPPQATASQQPPPPALSSSSLSSNNSSIDHNMLLSAGDPNSPLDDGSGGLGASKKKRKRCGECPGCFQKTNCSECGPCRSVRSHQICKMRKCDQLKTKKEKFREVRFVFKIVYYLCIRRFALAQSCRFFLSLSFSLSHLQLFSWWLSNDVWSMFGWLQMLTFKFPSYVFSRFFFI